MDCNTDLNTIIDTLLHEGFVPSHTQGYQYIQDAISIAVLQEYTDASFNRELYDQIAQKHNTTSTRVERAIRHTIELSARYCPENETLPTGLEFIAEFTAKVQTILDSQA